MAPEITDIPAEVTQWTEGWIAKNVRVSSPSYVLKTLAGDGSTRQFFRLEVENRTYVVLYDRGWILTKDYAAHQTFLEGQGLPVPDFLAVDPSRGFLLMEDLGDTLLQGQLKKEPKKANDRLESCAKLLAHMHGKTFPVPTELPAHSRRFDAALYKKELGFTLEHLSRGLLHQPPTSSKIPELDEFCESLDQLQPRVFCHRDYHTRNILFHQEKLVLIDFQDARLGPPGYDLASLIYDAYVPLTDATRSKLLRVYRETLANYPVSKEIDWKEFEASLERLAYQRTLKAAGSFASFFTRYGKKTHLPYLLPCLDNVKTLQKSAPNLNKLFPVEEWIPKINQMESENWRTLK